ncbi:MAG: hypothetical protein IKR41_07760 [Bacteroidales bacterium]|nr:hypothetical protein [Bacteroidales bacterium]
MTERRIGLYLLCFLFVISLIFMTYLEDSKYGGGILLVFLGILITILISCEDEENAQKIPGNQRRETGLRINNRIQVLAKKDSNFSLPVFLDYVKIIFLKTYISYTDEEKINEITPFFEYDINKIKKVPFTHVFVDKTEISDIKTFGNRCNVSVDFNAYFQTKYKGEVLHCKSEERWVFSRKADAVSVIPNGFGLLRCPSCGRIYDFSPSGICPHCNCRQNYESGQWIVSDVKRLKISQTNPQKDFLKYRPEIGTSDPSIVAPNLKKAEEVFSKLHSYRYPSFKIFESRIAKPYFMKICSCFASDTWNKARHLIYENSWQNIKFKLSLYKSYGYKRVFDSLEIKKTETVNYEADNFYQSVTVRIFAECYDYIINYEDGIIGGTNRQKRYFSQYWKFVSCIGFIGKYEDLEVCPCCGLSVGDVDNSGVCPYCMNKVNDGNFSWVLYSITEDEDYCGQ